jgi:hypothetical protein
MQSFGLEDGFIWAAQRRDTIDIARFKERISEKSSGRFLKNATIFLSLPLIREGRALAERFPAESPERKRITKDLKQFFTSIASNALCFLAILFSIFIMGEGIRDNFRYRSILSTHSDPQASLQHLKDDEDWLASYYRAPFYRHVISRRLVMKSNEAMAKLSSFRERREELLWRPVEEETDELVRVDLARKYLQQFGENGIYYDLASSIITETAQAKKYLENQIHLTKITTAFESALLKGAQSEEELENLYQQLLTLPFPDAVSADLYAQQKALLEQIGTERIELAKDKGKEKWLIDRDKYHEAMRDGDIVMAVEFLDRLLDQTVARDETEKLMADFQKRAVNEFNKSINIKSSKKLWGQARNMIQQALDNRQLVAQLGARQLKQLRSMHGAVDIAEDKDLYSLVVKYKTREHVTQYLRYAPLKKMGRSVTRYQQYLDRLSNPLNLKLVLANINWGGSCKNSDFFVTFNGKTIIEKTGFRPPKGDVSSQVGSTQFRAKLSDIAKVYAKITCSARWRGKNTAEVNWEGAVGNLRGLRLKLDSKGFITRTITFTLSGLPEEPVLPTWGS